MQFFSVGCSKDSGAENIAKQFLEDIEGGKAYKLVHKYVGTEEILEISRDSSGNVKAVQHYDDGSKSEVYLIDGTYTLFIDDEAVTDFEQSDIEEFVTSSLEEATFYVNETLPVFDLDIDADILDLADENLFVAIGQYDDETAYKYSFDKDGNFFECQDAYDDIRIDLDTTVAITLP